ncbi:sigma-70 family RNA polymerase sigma factor [Rudanella paleaurantiibacter]|uniref:Sigma-70 family RNA polymerase sigma factor n=1 Tax=Rudanella paleaurantiibacter TaxID=2614655 RepID=A0A7J5U042_9BACT|nr:sigma-70 family RNA polymerase sigma factor [Rudanella paleaurantiibacter]KAB7731116.1 sigma-70 family RNA polymerase sigma factor [Rudanella paleaurantiibacter]
MTPTTPSSSIRIRSAERSYKQLPDGDLIRLALATADTRYLNTLYTRQYRPVYNTCLYWLKDPDSAADCTQEVLIKVFQNLSSFEHQSSFSTWINAVTRNHCTDILRRQQRQPGHSSLNEAFLETEPGHWIAPADTSEDLWFYLRYLKPDDRQILHLKYEDDIKTEDLAKHLGITVSAAKMRLNRARTRLKALYERVNMGMP